MVTKHLVGIATLCTAIALCIGLVVQLKMNPDAQNGIAFAFGLPLIGAASVAVGFVTQIIVMAVRKDTTWKESALTIVLWFGATLLATMWPLAILWVA